MHVTIMCFLMPLVHLAVGLGGMGIGFNYNGLKTACWALLL